MAAVLGGLADGSLERAANDVHADHLVCLELQPVERRDRVYESGAASLAALAGSLDRAAYLTGAAQRIVEESGVTQSLRVRS